MKKEVGQKYITTVDVDGTFKIDELVTLIGIEEDNISYYQNENGKSGYLYDIDHELCEVYSYIEDELDKPEDMVNSPNHYIGDNGIEVEDVLRGFIGRYKYPYVAHRVASALEYLLRSPLKNGTQDIEKAKKNLEQALEFLNSIDNQ